VGRAVGRSPSSRGRRDLALSQGVTEASIDQSANSGWVTVNGTHDDVALLPDTVCHLSHQVIYFTVKQIDIKHAYIFICRGNLWIFYGRPA